MATKHQKISIELSSKYSKAEKTAIAQDVIDFIIERTQDKNIDKNNKKFPKYSKEYINSAEFRAGGKSASKVNLTLSEDMLDEMKLLNVNSDKIVIGYENGTEENAKADGNIRGTYGKSRGNPDKARDFLGLTSKDLSTILKDYPLRSTKSGKKAEDIRAETLADRFAAGLVSEEVLSKIELEKLKDLS